MTTTDDAVTMRQWARGHIDDAKAAAKAAARRKAQAVGDAAKARAATGWAATKPYRPTVFTVVGLTVIGMMLTAHWPISVAITGMLIATVGTVTAYRVTYARRRDHTLAAGDHGEEFEVRKAGAKARAAARSFAAAPAAYGAWLFGAALIGFDPGGFLGRTRLVVVLLAAAVLAWLVCGRHWGELHAANRQWEEVELAEESGDFELVEPTEILAPAATGDVDAEWTPAIRSVLDKHGVDAIITGYLHGPTVSRYDLTLGNTKVAAVMALAGDFAVELHGKPVRLVCPVPNKPVVGVEVPNKDRQIVRFADVLADIPDDAHPLTVALGRDLEGRSVTPNIADGPHWLPAGATGGGKSGLLNAIICTILKRCSPEQVQLVLIDPKRVELTAYENVPHLVMPVVEDPEEGCAALAWVVRDVEARYVELKREKVRNIGEYNAKMAREGRRPMPYRLVVVDELADLLMVAAALIAKAKRLKLEDGPVIDDPEESIVRATQLARAAGDHLVLATQRPSADVVTGLIKANVPTRVAFTCGNHHDSKVILDRSGAEKLLGRGDALFLSMDASEPIRVQVAWVDSVEIEQIVDEAIARYAPASRVELPARVAVERTVALRPADVILAHIAAHPGCSTADIAAAPGWMGRPLSQSQLSRELSGLVSAGLLSRVKDGRSWIDYRLTEAGESRVKVSTP